MKIKHKIFAGLFVVATMFILTAVFSLIATRRAVSNYDRLTAQTIPVIETVEDVMFGGLKIVSSTAEYALVHDNDAAAREEIYEINQGKILYSKSLDRYEYLVKNYFPDEMDHLTSIKRVGAELFEKAEKIQSLSGYENTDDQIMKVKDELEIAEKDFVNVINQALEHEEAEVIDRKKETLRAIEFTEIVIKLTTGLAFVFVLIFGTATARSITVPISELISATREIGRGNLEARVELKNRDELKELGDCITKMAEDLSSTLVSRMELEESERQLHALSQRGITTQERERARIAGELHDELGQRLSILNVEVEILKKNQHPTRESVERLADIINEVSQQLVRIYRGMSPSALQRFGLVEAIKHLALEYSESSGLSISFTHDDEKEFVISEETTLHVYRIAQESLTNIVKHSGAKNVTIDLRKESDEIALEISDDGTGISNEAIKAAKGIGLIGIKERALICGGRVIIDSWPGEGVSIKLKIPASRNAGSEQI